MEDKYILIVDDEKEIVSAVISFLIKEGYKAKGFNDAQSLFKFLEKKIPDLIILDFMLPDINGFEICKKIKETDRFSSIPVIFLTGNASEVSKVSGLDLGADDYIVKPFSLDELGARIRAVLRRNFPDTYAEEINVTKRLVMDLKKHQVKVDGNRIDLTPAEFKILELLSSRKGQVFPRDRILDYLWGEEKVVVERTIDVHVRHLREKLGEIGHIIKNVRGIGYTLEDDQ